MYYLDLYSFFLGIVTGIAAAGIGVGFVAFLFAAAGADSVQRGLSRPTATDWIALHRDPDGLASTTAAAETPPSLRSAPRPPRPATPSPRVRGKS